MSTLMLCFIAFAAYSACFSAVCFAFSRRKNKPWKLNSLRSVTKDWILYANRRKMINVTPLLTLGIACVSMLVSYLSIAMFPYLPVFMTVAVLLNMVYDDEAFEALSLLRVLHNSRVIRRDDLDYYNLARRTLRLKGFKFVAIATTLATLSPFTEEMLSCIRQALTLIMPSMFVNPLLPIFLLVFAWFAAKYIYLLLRRRIHFSSLKSYESD